MTPAKRRPGKLASEGPKKATPEDTTQLLGPDGEPIAEDASKADAGGNSAPPAEPGQADPEDRPTTQSPGRSRSLYPLPVWPD